MKNISQISISILIVCSSLMLYSQKNCVVLKQSISGSYEGKCKNGLANGRGIAVGTDKYEGQFSKGLPQGEGKYTWANGDIYTGEWAEGMRHGIGKFIYNKNGNDSIKNGLWQKDEYKGPKPDAPNVTLNSGVDRYNFKKSTSTLNRVMIDIYQNGARNKRISNLRLSTTSGQDIFYGFLAGYDNVVFPVTIKVAYTTSNKLGTSTYLVKFDFTISEPGDWTVELYN